MFLFDDQLNENLDLHRGDLLIAEPLLDDPNFSRSVILVCEHQDDGSFGLVINKPAMITIEESSNSLLQDNGVYIGGPVEQNTLHIVHRIDELEESTPLRDGIYWGGNYEQLNVLHSQGLLNPSNCKLFMGYSGWGKQQLEDELTRNSWVIGRHDLSILFEVDPENLWREILKSMGEKYRMLSNYPTDPRMN